MSNANQNNANRNLSPREQFDAAAASTNSFADGFHAIATAYSDYTKKSFEDTRSFVEKLSGVKSVDKAISNRIRKVGFRLVRGRVTEDRRVVSRSGRAILQAVRWFPCQGDPDKSISLPSPCQRGIARSSRGFFPRPRAWHPGCGPNLGSISVQD
jgi:Phasin protein